MGIDVRDYLGYKWFESEELEILGRTIDGGKRGRGRIEEMGDVQ